MLADVITPAANWSHEHPLLTYEVPTALEAEIQPGQLVALPYGERLVEGLIWRTGTLPIPTDTPIRPLRALLDPVPALLPYQMELAQWIAEYYDTPLTQVASMMLPPGLMQRSRMVLRLAESDNETLDLVAQSTSPRLRALIGLLLSEGEVNVESLKEMLGAKKAKELLKEVDASSFINNDAQLDPPRARPRTKRIVRLIAQGEALAAWRTRTEAILQQHVQSLAPIPLAADNVRRRPALGEKKRRKQPQPNPWDTLSVPASIATLTLTPQDKEGLRAQHQLAALELLQQDLNTNSPLTPHALCLASGMTPAQLQQLVRENIVVIEVTEVRRNPLGAHSLTASQPLTLTPDQQYALDSILTPQYSLHGETAGNSRRGDPLWSPSVPNNGRTHPHDHKGSPPTGMYPPAE